MLMKRDAAVAMLALLLPSVAHAGWSETRDLVNRITALAAAQSADNPRDSAVPWFTMEQGIALLGKSCEEFDDLDEFTKRECASELPELKAKVGETLSSSLTYSTDVEFTLGEYDFDKHLFPIRVQHGKQLAKKEPHPCADAVAVGRLGTGHCVFATKPTAKMIAGQAAAFGSMWTEARYWQLQADHPSPATPELPAETGKAVRDALGTKAVPARLYFRFAGAADQCAEESESQGQAILSHCWGDVEVLGWKPMKSADMNWPTAVREAIVW